MLLFPHAEHHKHTLDFKDSSKRKDEENNYNVGKAPKTPHRSPRQFLSLIAHKTSLQIKTDDHDTSSGQMSDSELLLFAAGRSSVNEGRGLGK